MKGKKTYRYGPHNASQTDKLPLFVTWGSYGMWLWLRYSFNRHIATEKQFWRVCIQSIHKVNFKKKESMSRRWVVNFMPQLRYTRERTPVPVKQKVWLVPDPVWTFWWREKSLACQKSNPGSYSLYPLHCTDYIIPALQF